MNNIKGLSGKKRAEVAALSLYEISTLVQQLESILDDSERDVIGVSVNANKSHVHLESITFLIEFMEFDIEVDDSPDYPYELKAEIGGVEFIAVMSVAEIADLKTTIPDQWEYIQRKVQVVEG
ncbi:hypothetical protein [Sporosarcina sp. E16_8]|uniref:hypothetical protein n=1 Tax=Sporosarcina sp. E16_8 TaxID=2789295 RepID=UPI001A932A7D|nr:hypothetical protein [Sporosarcina sp. E16_8]MBO0586489.1 hypothetical protein [Sporosarcina sp. E16_8]